MKRKRSTDEDRATSGAQDPTAQGPKVESATGINGAIGKMDNRLIADYVLQRTKQFGDHLSPVELEDMHIPESAIIDTSGFDQERLIQGLPSFLEQFAQHDGRSGSLSLAARTPGAPHTLMLTAAGLRAADLIRYIRA
ncbi:MAG: hypothetical protein Q9201_000971 [Fulgogasparrea decipioides]